MMKVKLTKERLLIVTVAGLILFLLLLYLSAFSPLINELGTAHSECKTLETEVMQTREKVDPFKKDFIKKSLIPEKDISSAIGELTKQGKSARINFVSLTPKEIEKREMQYNILPIETETESSFKEMGLFFGSLDDLEKSLITVRSFNISSDRVNPDRLRTNLVLNMYLTYAE